MATPEQGRVAISVAAAPTVGEVTPVYVSVANGTDDTRAVVPSQVFALNDAGERVAPLPPGEAARQAGSAKELEGAVKSGAVSGVGGAAVGAAAGAIAGTAGRSAGWFGFGSPGAGALVGTAFGGAYGVFSGAEKGQSKADQQANQQLEAVSLKPEEVRKDFTVSGYVFFPKGPVQPGRDAAGRSRNRRHRSRPRTLALSRRYSSDEIITIAPSPFPFSAGSQITALLAMNFMSVGSIRPEANPSATPRSTR